MDTLWTEAGRIESAKRVIAGMRTIARTGIRRGHTISYTIPTPNTTVILVMARYSSPIIIVNAVYWCALGFEINTMADILISSDTSTDSGAETRDRKLSGMAGIGRGTIPVQVPSKIDYNHTVLIAPIVIKAILRTGNSGNNTMMANVLVEYA